MTSTWAHRLSRPSPFAVHRSLFAGRSSGLAIPGVVRVFARFLKQYVPWVYGLIVAVATWCLMLGGKVVRCPTGTLGDVIDAYIGEGERVGLLKVDVEGGEVGVLKGMGKRHWGVVERCVCRIVAWRVHAKRLAHSLNSLARMCVECAVSNLGEVLQLVDTYGSFENVVAKQTDELQGTSLWMVYCS